jgi:hypothetical protein
MPVRHSSASRGRKLSAILRTAFGPRRCSASRSSFVADNPAHRRIMAQPLGVVHIFVSGKSSEHRLSQHFDESMPTVPASACVSEYIAGHRSEAERIVEFPVREQAGIGSNHRSAKLEHQPAVESSLRTSPFDSPAGFAMTASFDPK